MTGILEKLLPSVGTVLGGRYRVESTLGEGGFGVVFLAVQTNLDRKVAVKMLLPHALTDSMAVHRFHREVDLARRLEHPNTVRIFDRGQTDAGLHYYVMEHVKGGGLDELLRSHGPLPVHRVKWIAEQTLMSLGEAHEAGIVHRDLKPGNIMLSRVFGQDDFVKVLDFGIAKAFGADEQKENASTAPTTRGLIGTPHYMSPEQARGVKDLDGRSDLYALALIMAELMTGERVVDGGTPLLIVSIHAQKAPVPIPQAVLDSPIGLVIQRATAKDRDVRYASALEMLDDLQNIELPITDGRRQSWPLRRKLTPGVTPMTPLGLGGDRGTSQDDTLADLGGDKRPRAASASLMTVLLVLLIAVGAAAYIAATGSDESNDDNVEHDSDSADVEVVADLGNASLELDEIDLVTAVDQGMAEQDRRAGAFQLNIGEADRRVATAHSRATHTAADSADESHNSDPTPAISSAAAAVAQARVAAQAAQPEQTVAVIYVQGTPSSAEVRLGRRRVCRNLRSRCRVELPLGDERHRITVTADDYRDHSFRVDRSDDGDTYRVSLTLDI